MCSFSRGEDRRKQVCFLKKTFQLCVFPSPGADLHFDACAATESVPCTFSSKLRCALRKVRARQQPLHKAIPLRHRHFAASRARPPTQLTSSGGHKLPQLCWRGTRARRRGRACPATAAPCAPSPGGRDPAPAAATRSSGGAARGSRTRCRTPPPGPSAAGASAHCPAAASPSQAYQTPPKTLSPLLPNTPNATQK